MIITPTPYSKKLLEGYGINKEIRVLSNGIDLKRFCYDENKIDKFRNAFSLKEDDLVVLSVGLYFERKGILDFIEVAKNMPHVKFIWFGYTPLYAIPKKIRYAIKNHPQNVIFPGYVKGDILEGAYLDTNCFFFPSYEETEGIVVLEALASLQVVLVRDIPVYNPWLVNQVNCFKGMNNHDFINQIDSILNHEFIDLKDKGREIAKQRSLSIVGNELKSIYETVLNKI